MKFYIGIIFSFAILLVNLSARGQTSPAILYYGGPVISHVKVQVIYWGNVPQDFKTKLEQFYPALVNSDYIDQLAEYDTSLVSADSRKGSPQKISRGEFLSAKVIQPKNTATNITQSDIESEFEYQISSGFIPQPDENTFYAIHFQPGTSVEISFGMSCREWEGDHEYYHSSKYGNIYYAMFPCHWDLSSFGTTTLAISHELAEAITDPASPRQGQTLDFPTGWISKSSDEIGDLCAWRPATLVALDGAQYNVQQEWMNSLGACGKTAFREMAK